ncbi:MAG TPA: transferase [Candidatus Omnitrophica bacterium]|nr:transferase [Candidatus Omnitrophota bacterium]
MEGISTKDFLGKSKKNLSSLYIYSNASSFSRFLCEQTLLALFGWMPTPAGILARILVYKLLSPHGSRVPFIEANVDIKYFNKIFCGRSVFVDRNCRLHSSSAEIHIGDNSRIMFGSYLCAFSSGLKEKGGIFIGNGCWVGIYAVLACGGAAITIGDYTLIGPNVTLVTGNHQFKADVLIAEQAYKQLPISIGSDCWIGANSVILGGVTIGDHSVVAAGAVVTKDVSARTIVGGVPARVIESIR